MQVAIFDLDGTLVDSMPYWRNHLINYFTDASIDLPTNFNRSLNQAGIFDAYLKQICEKNPSLTPKKIISTYHEIMQKSYNTEITTKPYVYDFLDTLKNNNFSICLATATPKHLFENMMKRLSLNHYFDFYTTVPEIGVAKNKPDIYLHCADRYKVPAQACIVFEDNLQAATTAKTAGFHTIGIADESSDWAKDDMMRICDDYIFSYKDLLNKDWTA